MYIPFFSKKDPEVLNRYNKVLEKFLLGKLSEIEKLDNETPYNKLVFLAYLQEKLKKSPVFTDKVSEYQLPIKAEYKKLYSLLYLPILNGESYLEILADEVRYAENGFEKIRLCEEKINVELNNDHTLKKIISSQKTVPDIIKNLMNLTTSGRALQRVIYSLTILTILIGSVNNFVYASDLTKNVFPNGTKTSQIINNMELSTKQTPITVTFDWHRVGVDSSIKDQAEALITESIKYAYSKTDAKKINSDTVKIAIEPANMSLGRYVNVTDTLFINIQILKNLSQGANSITTQGVVIHEATHRIFSKNHPEYVENTKQINNWEKNIGNPTRENIDSTLKIQRNLVQEDETNAMNIQNEYYLTILGSIEPSGNIDINSLDYSKLSEKEIDNSEKVRGSIFRVQTQLQEVKQGTYANLDASLQLLKMKILANNK